MTDRDTPGTSIGEPEIRAFLIADVRGYTTFTQQQGDEAAARLASRFADVAREGVSSAGGTLVELRGDEALAVFSSSRAALRAAVDLQDRFVGATEEDPGVPLRVGIGLDAGEAVAVQGGYRGGALNLAARLCSRAGPGEILASDAIVHMAGSVSGVRMVALKDLRLKGLSAPVRAFRVLPEGLDPAERLAAIPPVSHSTPPSQPRGPAARRNAVLVGVVVAAVAVLAGLLFELSRGGGSGARADDGSSPSTSATPVVPGLLRIDIATGKVTSAIAIDQAGRVVLGNGFAWVEAVGDSVVKVNPGSNTAVATSRGIFSITPGSGGLWGRAEAGPLRFLDARTNRVRPIRGTDSIGVSALAYGNGGVWVTNLYDSTLTRIDAATERADHPVVADPGPAEAVCIGCENLSVGSDAVWFQNTEGSVSRLDLGSHRSTVVSVPQVQSLAADQVFLWTLSRDGNLEEISSDGNTVLRRKQLGSGASLLAVGGGRVWVGDVATRTITPYDESSLVAGPAIRLSVIPVALAVDAGSLWVTHP